MSVATITARVNDTDSKNFEALCEAAGLNVSTAINLFIKAVLKERRILFAIERTSDMFYSPENQAYVLKSVRELREGKGQVHELIEDCND